MILRTAKSTFVASTFAAMAAHQDEMQGSFASIEIGEHTVDVDACETADEMAAAIREDLADVIDAVRDEAALTGDAQTVTDCDAATTDIAALERVCAVLSDAAAQD